MPGHDPHPLPNPNERAPSRRAALRLFAAQAGVVALGGCMSARSGETGSVPSRTRPATSAIAADPALIAVTTRKPAGSPARRPWFSGERSPGTRAVRVAFTPPDTSLIGRVSTAVSGRWSIEGVEPVGAGDPVAALAGAMTGRDVLIYVHGYNETFETAATSAAELSDGVGFAGATVAFSWPSNAAFFDYGYDRESALWSRDAFQEVLEALLRNATIGRVHIVAHSMGCLLTLETMRQLWSQSGSGDLAARAGAVVFASPDIDVDLFATSLPRIGPLARHITVIFATNDRALAVSRQLAGGVPRVGAADRAVLEPLGVTVADASDYGGGILRHDLFLTDADVQGVVRRAIERRS